MSIENELQCVGFNSPEDRAVGFVGDIARGCKLLLLDSAIAREKEWGLCQLILRTVQLVGIILFALLTDILLIDRNREYGATSVNEKNDGCGFDDEKTIMGTQEDLV